MKLSSQAIHVLEILKKESPTTVEELSGQDLDQSMVHRAALELQEAGLLEIEEEEEFDQKLTATGEEIIENGSPEHRLISRVEGGVVDMKELQDLPLDVALGKAREKGWIDIENGSVTLTDKGEEAASVDAVRKRLESRDFEEGDEERGLVETVTGTLRNLELTDEGREIEIEAIEEDFNVEARVETPLYGRKHFYKQIIDFARDKWLEMGFQEMDGDFVVPSLLNFDALYTPQDHPARELHDTFFLESPEKADLDRYGEKVEYIGQVHENGWETGSKGWGYDWSKEEARKNVLRTHTTTASALTLHQIDIEDRELPAKYFKVSRNFRNETLDKYHLAELIQTEGIVVGEDLNFKHLKGYIEEFFQKMGYDNIRMIPSYYPYTEMSVEPQIWDEEDEEWVGLGGAGIFRPEVVKPLLGEELTVLAWGLGFDRIAFLQAGLEDIRELYRNDIENLRETPYWSSD